MDSISNRMIELLSKKNLEEKLRALVDLVMEVTKAESVELYVYEEEHRQLRLMALTGTPPNAASIKIKSSEIGSDLSGPFEFDKRLAIPLKVGGDLVGVLSIYKGKAMKDFEMEQCAMDQCAKILKLCLEDENTKSNIFKLSALEEVDSALIAMPMDFKILYKRILEFVVRIANAERGTIWFVGDKELVLSYSFGISEEEILNRRIKMGHGMIGWIAQNAVPLLSTSSKVDPRASLDIFDFKVKSAIGAPILKDDKVIGVIMLINRENTDFYRTYRHFDEFDLSILISIVNRLKLSINQIELYKRLESENVNLRELQRQNDEYIAHQREQIRLLNALQKIMKAMRHTQDIRNVYKIVLIGLTSGAGFGFNRALLLEKDEEDKVLVAHEWIGPQSAEDVASAWTTAKKHEQIHADFAQYLRDESLAIDLSEGLTKYAKGKNFSYTGDYIFDRVINRSKIVHVTPALANERGIEFLDLLNFLQVKEFVCIPLVGRREVYGAIVLDNKYTNNPITDDMIDMLGIFSDSVGLTIESLKGYSELADKTLNLEKQKMEAEYFKDFAQNVLENLDVAIMVVDRERHILEWNRKSEELFDFKKARTINSKLNILGPEFFDISNVAERVYDVKETITLNDYSFNFHSKEMFLNMKFSPLREKDTSRIIGYIAMFEDVTKRHVLEIELRNRERLAVLGEMSARVAHEIRNPLSAIGGFAQRAKKVSGEEKVSRYLEIILKETKRLEEIVNQTLEFSRGNMRSDFILESVNKVVRESMDLYSDKFEIKEVEARLELSGDEIPVSLEPNHFKEVIMNLIQNALEAVPENVGVVRIRTYHDDGSAYVEIWNNGDPIPPDRLDRVFQPFYTTKTYGTGLGLAICRKIIEDEHDGKINVESDPEGTKFTIMIPKNVKD